MLGKIALCVLSLHRWTRMARSHQIPSPETSVRRAEIRPSTSPRWMNKQQIPVAQAVSFWPNQSKRLRRLTLLRIAPRRCQLRQNHTGQHQGAARQLPRVQQFTQHQITTNGAEHGL